jgi:cell division protein FtsN
LSFSRFSFFKKKNALAALFFLVALNIYAGGSSDPTLLVTTQSQDSRQISLDWNKVKDSQKYRYGIYRANRNEKTVSLVKEVNSSILQFTDTNLPPPLSNYYYFAYHVNLNASLDPFIVFPDGKKITDEEMGFQLATIPAYGGVIGSPVSEPDELLDEETPETIPITPPIQIKPVIKTPEGVYVGLVLFSNKIDVPPMLIPLDPGGRRELLERLTINYVPTKSYGTALYFAEHTTLENLFDLEKSGKLPVNLDSVSIITFTDGLDTSSTDVALESPGGISFKGKQTGAYMSYISQQLKTKKIGGKKIDAWAIGILGKDVTSGVDFTKTLESIASSSEQVIQLSEISQIENRLGEIAERLNLWKSAAKLTFTVPAYPVGTTLRITFDNYLSTPERADSYIEGRVTYNNDRYTLTGLSAAGITLTDKNPAAGRRTDYGIEYTITIDDHFNESSLMQWYKQTGYEDWQLNSEFNTQKKTDFSSNRKSAIIYLLLDCSSSLNDYQINEIRDAVTRFLDKIYNTASTVVTPAFVAGNYEGTEINIVKSTPEMMFSANSGTKSSETAKKDRPKAKNQQIYRPQAQPDYVPAEDHLAQQQPLEMQYIQSQHPAAQYVPQQPPPQYGQASIEIYDFPPASQTPPPSYTTSSISPLYMPTPTVNLSEPYSGFWVQVGSFTDLRRAQDTWRRLFLNNCTNSEIFGKQLNGMMHYRVKIGPYQERNDAESALKIIRNANIGFNDAYIIWQ